MALNERTSLLRPPHENGENGWHKIKPANGSGGGGGRLIIQMPKDAIFDFEVFSGSLGLVELLPYQDDPWWQKLRNTIFYTFWFAMVLTLLTACTLAYMHGGSNNCKMLNTITSKNTTNMELFTSTLATTSLLNEVSGKLAVLST